MELEFNLTPSVSGFSYTPATVTFSDFHRILEEADMLNSLLSQVQVDDENIKTAKKLVAEVRKQFNVLDRQRIEAKKDILGNFSDYEQQVKEIGAVVQEGENLVRSKIRELEEIERAEKEEEVRALWEERSDQYEFTEWLTYEDWFEPKYLNKSQSLNKTEEELVEWLEAKRNDVMVIESHQQREELMIYYKQNDFSLALAMNQLAQFEAQKKELVQTKRVEDVVSKDREMYHITVYDEDDYFKMIGWLNRNDIVFTVDVK